MSLRSATSRNVARSSGCSTTPQATVATDVEALTLIENRRLFGLGIGFVDAHLLAATLLTPAALLWTRDKRLATVAAGLGLAATGEGS